jgi:hypothetical protein
VSAPSSDVDGPRDAVPAPSDVDSELDATIPDVQACWGPAQSAGIMGHPTIVRTLRSGLLRPRS